MSYLDEKKYQRINKKIKTTGIIILIVGIYVIVMGIFTLNSASKMDIPERESNNWFESVTDQDNKEDLGIAMIMVGIFITVAGCMVRFVVPNQRNINAYMVQQSMPIAQEGIEKIAPSIGKVAKEISKGIKESKDEE